VTGAIPPRREIQAEPITLVRNCSRTNDAETIKADADKTKADADELQQRCEQQLRDAQDKPASESLQ
jgi:hypothetical protein